MYQKMSEECKASLRKQFGFSTLELGQMEEFMANNLDNNLSKPVTEILDALMKDVDLNDRQKVMVSYTLGASVGVKSVIQDLEESNIRKVSPILNMQVGQGG